MTEEEFVLQWLSRCGEVINNGDTQMNYEICFTQAQRLYRDIKRMYNEQYCKKDE